MAIPNETPKREPTAAERATAAIADLWTEREKLVGDKDMQTKALDTTTKALKANTDALRACGQNPNPRGARKA